jgi:hypothetical protein
VARYFDQFPQRSVRRAYGGSHYSSTHYEIGSSQ